jgi:hypothetical protein
VALEHKGASLKCLEQCLTYQGEEKKSMAHEVFFIAVVQITPRVAERKKY